MNDNPESDERHFHLFKMIFTLTGIYEPILRYCNSKKKNSKWKYFVKLFTYFSFKLQIRRTPCIIETRI